MVTSGLVPGVIMYQMFVISGSHIIDYSFQYGDFSLIFSIVPIALFGFLITLGAAFRLAKFNLLTEKVSFFRGVPTPANALFIGALPLFVNHPLIVDFKDFILIPITLVIISVLSVFFMNIHWKMIAFKGFDISNLSEVIFTILLLILSFSMFYFLGLAAFVGIITLYIIMSLLKNVIGI